MTKKNLIYFCISVVIVLVIVGFGISNSIYQAEHCQDNHMHEWHYVCGESGTASQNGSQYSCNNGEVYNFREICE